MVKQANNPALQAVLDDQQSTHGYAPEATAAKLLRVLRTAYPEIQTHLLTDASDPATLTTSPDAQTQLDLQRFWREFFAMTQTALDHATAGIAIPIPLSLKDKLQSSTVQIIRHLCSSKKWATENKTLILKKIARLMLTHPGGEHWNDYEQQYSINRIYNATTQQMEAVVACPAETFHLLSAAILDNERYEANHDGALHLRIESLGNLLLKTIRQELSMEREYCSAGQSHQLLALLYDTYLDRPRGTVGATPIHAISNEGTFLQETLSSQVKRTLSALSLEERIFLMIRLVQWNQSKESKGVNPLIECLRKIYPIDGEDPDAGWKKVYQSDLIQQCHHVGLDDHRLGITDYVETLQDLPEQNFATDKIVINLLEIMQTKPPQELTGVPPQLHSLVPRAIMALDHFKVTLTPQTDGRAIVDFYIAQKNIDVLFIYQTTIGALTVTENEDFRRTEGMLYQALDNFYQDYDITKHLPDTFEEVYTHFLQAKERFLSQEIAFINDAIPALFRDFSGETARRVVSVNFALSDEQLMMWKASYDRYIAPRRCSQETAIYLYNHIFLHALFVPLSKWSTLFKAALSIIEHELSLDLPRSHPQYQPAIAHLKGAVEYVGLLNNIHLIIGCSKPEPQPTQPTAPEHTRIQPIWERARILHYVQRFWEDMQIKRQLDVLLTQTIAIMCLGETAATFPKDSLITILNENKRYYLSDYQSLRQLLSFSEQQLSDSQKTSFISGRYLLNAIKNDAELRSILELPPTPININFQKLLLGILLSSAGSFLYQHPQDVIHYLFSLPTHEAVKDGVLQQLEQIDRRRHAAPPSPPTRIQRPVYLLNFTVEQLSSLFALPLPQFTSNERALFLTLIHPYIPIILTNFGQVLAFLTKSALSEEQLTIAQRTQILSRVVGRFNASELQTAFSEFPPAIYLAAFCNSTEQMVTWFKMPILDFNAEQRETLLCAILSNLTPLIPTKHVLDELFSVTEDLLTEEQRLRVLTALTQHQNSFIYASGNPLQALMMLNVTRSMKTRILQFLKAAGMLPNMLVEFQAFIDLYKLHNVRFDNEQRTIVFDGIEHQITTIVTTIAQFKTLFSLAIIVFSKGIWQKICDAMLSQLDALIDSNGDNLLKIMAAHEWVEKKIKATVHKKFIEQITAKLIEIAPRLPAMIQHKNQLHAILEYPCSAEQMSAILENFTASKLGTYFITWPSLMDVLVSLPSGSIQRRRMIELITPEQLTIWHNQPSSPILSMLLLFFKNISIPQNAIEFGPVRAAITTLIMQEGALLFKEDFHELQRVFGHLYKLLTNEERGYLLSTTQQPTLCKMVGGGKDKFLWWFIHTGLIDQFNETERTLILNAGLENAPRHVVSQAQNLYYYLVNPTYLTPAQREKLFAKVNWETLPWVDGTIEILQWFLTSSSIFNEAQRTSVLRAFIRSTETLLPTDFLTTLDWHKLDKLFELPIALFTPEQRNLLWTEFLKSNRLATITKKYPTLLQRLLALPIELLDKEKRGRLSKIKTSVSVAIPGTLFGTPATAPSAVAAVVATSSLQHSRGVKRTADEASKPSEEEDVVGMSVV